MTTTTGSSGYLRRFLGASALDVGIYEEIEADRSAVGQALLTVLVSSVAAGIGASGFGYSSFGGVVFIATVSVIGWAAWALVMFEIGVRLLPQPQTRSDPGELLRTIGFSTAPGVVRALGVFPSAAIPAFVVGTIWMLVAMIVAVRQALDYQSTVRAVAVCVAGLALAVLFALGIGLLFGPTLH